MVGHKRTQERHFMLNKNICSKLTTMTRAPCRKNSCLKKESSKKWCDYAIDMFSQVISCCKKNHLMQY